MADTPTDPPDAETDADAPASAAAAAAESDREAEADTEAADTSARPAPRGRRPAPEAARDEAMVAALDRGRPRVGVFVDLENMAWSPDSANVTFDIARVMAFLERTARPTVRRVYADWSRMRDFRVGLLRAGFEQVQCTYVNATKNALDMQLAVDALEAGLDGGLDAVALVTADSDFGPLARTLRRRGLSVIGIGWAEKAADLYRAQCDVFVDYETLISDRPRRPAPAKPPMPPRPSRPAPRPAAAEDGGAPAADRPFLYDPRGDAAPDADAPETEEDTDGAFASTFETDTGERRGS
jgi:hypothetical protein